MFPTHMIWSSVHGQPEMSFTYWECRSVNKPVSAEALYSWLTCQVTWWFTFYWLHLENWSEVNVGDVNILEGEFKANVWQVCLQNHALIGRNWPIRGPVKPSSWRPKLAVVSISPIKARFPNFPRFLFSGSERRRSWGSTVRVWTCKWSH